MATPETNPWYGNWAGYGYGYAPSYYGSYGNYGSNYGNYGSYAHSHYPGYYSSYGYGRKKRAADPAAVSNPESNADPHMLHYHYALSSPYNSYLSPYSGVRHIPSTHHAAYSLAGHYHPSAAILHRRKKRSAEPHYSNSWYGGNSRYGRPWYGGYSYPGYYYGGSGYYGW